MAGETMGMHPDIMELRAKYELAAEAPTLRAVTGLTFLAGLYLAISPWVVGFNGFTTLAANNLIVGIAVAMLALGLASASERTHGIAWITPLIGVWTIISPWVVSGNVATTGTIWSNVVTGVITLLLGLGAMFGMNRSPVRPVRSANRPR
ncbi:SPW repeat protein [Nonomuraea helvata]|uniref:SPW repeat protein n=1 Tax=Nonomuraea helvata TaxID=37484 RepID=A0ABV5SIZ7_9ACTN